MVGLIAQSTDVTMYATMPIEQDAASPEPVRQRPGDQLPSGEPDQAGGDGQLRDGGRRIQLGGQSRERRQVEIHRDRTEDRQQQQQRRQQPAERGRVAGADGAGMSPAYRARRCRGSP